MPPDKSWMQLPRSTMAYYNGVPSFLDYACRHIQEDDMKILCPYVKCSNRYRKIRSEVHKHLLEEGIRRDYTTWYCHGENGDRDTDNDRAENDENGNLENFQQNEMYDMIEEGFSQDPNEEAQRFYELVKEVEQPLYPDCEKYSNLSFMVKLMHIKCINNWSNKSFNMLLELLNDAFPMCKKMHTSNYNAKKNYQRPWSSL
ncbi:hypothetical protein CISIN_1g041832mg [Citrus sinensis]|uniref:Transposase-associated domain-containing protein n=1 Tax=Citrus sinensis TaxID=2711 RepID=A0A067DL82_CITSI|nr:hypothetical protein CISIN_1g041832mg [Citrus sinensis]